MATGQLGRERGGLARRATVTGLVSSLLSLAPPLLAQTAQPVTGARPGAGSEAAPPGCSARRAEEDDASAAFEQFQCTLAAREYARALAILESACAGAPDAACAFNRALVYHAWLEQPDEAEREHCQLARRNYLAFLDRDPYSEQGGAAADALQELEQFCPQPPGAPLAPPAPAPGIRPLAAEPALPALALPPSEPAEAQAAQLLRGHPAPRASVRVTAGRMLLGVGSAVAVAAALSWLRMSRADADLVQQRQPDGTISRTSANEALDETRHDYQRWAWGLGVSASALLATGALLLLVDGPSTASWTGAIGPGFVSASYGTSF